MLSGSVIFIGPEIAVIANPTSMHLEYAQKSLEAGCHVYLEKPVSHNLNGLDNLIELQKIFGGGVGVHLHPSHTNDTLKG